MWLVYEKAGYEVDEADARLILDEELLVMDESHLRKDVTHLARKY
jgi:hypothetical protein